MTPDITQLNRIRWLVPDQTARRAALYVCGRATHPDDARLLLEACGLVGYKGNDFESGHRSRSVHRHGLLDEDRP